MAAGGRKIGISGRDPVAWWCSLPKEPALAADWIMLGTLCNAADLLANSGTPFKSQSLRTVFFYFDVVIFRVVSYHASTQRLPKLLRLHLIKSPEHLRIMCRVAAYCKSLSEAVETWVLLLVSAGRNLAMDGVRASQVLQMIYVLFDDFRYFFLIFESLGRLR